MRTTFSNRWIIYVSFFVLGVIVSIFLSPRQEIYLICSGIIFFWIGWGIISFSEKIKIIKVGVFSVLLGIFLFLIGSLSISMEGLIFNYKERGVYFSLLQKFFNS